MSAMFVLSKVTFEHKRFCEISNGIRWCVVPSWSCWSRLPHNSGTKLLNLWLFVVMCGVSHISLCQFLSTNACIPLHIQQGSVWFVFTTAALKSQLKKYIILKSKNGTQIQRCASPRLAPESESESACFCHKLLASSDACRETRTHTQTHTKHASNITVPLTIVPSIIYTAQRSMSRYR